MKPNFCIKKKTNKPWSWESLNWHISFYSTISDNINNRHVKGNATQKVISNHKVAFSCREVIFPLVHHMHVHFPLWLGVPLCAYKFTPFSHTGTWNCHTVSCHPRLPCCFSSVVNTGPPKISCKLFFAFVVVSELLMNEIGETLIYKTWSFKLLTGP